MRAWKWAALLAMVLLAGITVRAEAARAEGGRPILLASMDGDGGDTNIDLAVRQVKIQPIRAHVGDVIQIDVLVENKAEGSRTTPAEVYANGKRIGYQLFTWGWSGNRLFPLHFSWNTAGLAPGAYTIKAEAFVFEDTSPFDNELTAKQPVVLVAPGSSFPGGQTAGGEYTETDPRFNENTLK